MFVLILILIICVLLWAYWLREVKKSSAPLMRGTLPIIGYTHKFVGDTERLWCVIRDITNFSLANGGVIRVIIALKTYYVVTEPEDLITIGNSLLRKHFAFDFAKPWLGEGMLTASISAWKTHRKLLSPAFSVPLLQSFIPVLNEQARITVEGLAKVVDQGPVDISYYFRDNATKVLCRTSLDLSLEEISEHIEDYAIAADKTLEQLASRFQNAWLHTNFMYWLTGLKRKEDEWIRVMNQTVHRIIRAKMAQAKNFDTNDQKQKQFLNLLLEMASEGKLSQKDVIDEIHTMMVAGTDTSSWMLNNVCVMLGTYPEVQDKVALELLDILGGTDRDLTKEDLQKMVYTEAVLKETLRLHPVASASVRTVEEGLQLKNHYIHPGDHVIMGFYGLNRHPMWGADADEFKPERWLGTDILSKQFAGFGIGKRNCIGRTYAMMAIKVLIGHLVRNYRMSADATKLRMKVDFITKPVAGHFVSLTERNKKEMKESKCYKSQKQL